MSKMKNEFISAKHFCNWEIEIEKRIDAILTARTKLGIRTIIIQKFNTTCEIQCSASWDNGPFKINILLVLSPGWKV